MSRPVLHIRPRYHRWHVDPGVEWVESNTTWDHLDWRIPLSRVALVLVDVWDRHYLKDTHARAEEIIQQRLRPLVDRCRAAGLPIVHAPSPPQAEAHPNWLRLEGWDRRTWPADEDWPPPEFRQRQGRFADYASPAEPRDPEREEVRAGLRIHPDMQPAAGEPVVSTGEELHLWCRQQGVMFLLYAGFNTNACIVHRDYGTIDMNRRGYAVLVVRDGTTGMESAATHEGLGQTRATILNLEMFGCGSVTCGEIAAGLPGGAGPDPG